MKRNKLIAFAIVLLTLVAMACSLHFSANVPHLDDYDQVLQFLLNIGDADGLWERILLVFSERNEHRTGIYHLIVLLDNVLFGSINFKHLIFVSNLFFAAIVYLIYQIFRQFNSDNIYFVPILLLLAIPYSAILNWSSAGLIYLPTIFFSLLTIWALNRESKKSFLLAMMTGTLAVASSGAGLILFISTIPFFFGKRSRSMGLIWLALFAFLLVVYFTGYHPEKPGNPLMGALSSPHIVLANYIVFYGALLTAIFEDYYLWNIVFGGLFLLLSFYLFNKNRAQITICPVLASGVLLALGLGATTALMRSYMGLGVTSADRYRMFQCLLPIFLYLWALKNDQIKTTALYWLIGISVFVFGVRWEYNYNRLKEHRHRLAYGMYAYGITGSASYLPVKKPEQEEKLFDDTAQAGIYSPYEVDVAQPLKTHLVERVAPQHVRVVKGVEEENEEHYLLQGWAFMKFSPNVNLDIWMKLESQSHVFYLPTGPYFYSRSLIENSESGLTFVLSKQSTDIPPGKYKLSIVLTQPIKGIVGTQPVNKTIRVKGG